MTAPRIHVGEAIKLVRVIGVYQVAAVCAAIFLATMTFRDVLFCLAGVLIMVVLYVFVQTNKLDLKNSKSRIIIHFNDVKKDFSRQMERFDTIYAKENFFINNYSKGLYQHVSFDEQLDIIKWVETVERRLQDESLKQFEDFQASMSEMNDLGVSTAVHANDHTAAVTGENRLTAEMSLRDITKEIETIDNINIRQVDEKQIKNLFAEIKTVLNDFYKRNEASYKLWGELNNQTMDFFRKLFSTDHEALSRQYVMFSLSVDEIFSEAPTLFQNDSALSKFLGGNENSQEISKSLYAYDWDTLRTKITGDNNMLISRNSQEVKVVTLFNTGKQRCVQQSTGRMLQKHFQNFKQHQGAERLLPSDKAKTQRHPERVHPQAAGRKTKNQDFQGERAELRGLRTTVKARVRDQTRDQQAVHVKTQPRERVFRSRQATRGTGGFQHRYRGDAVPPELPDNPTFRKM